MSDTIVSFTLFLFVCWAIFQIIGGFSDSSTVGQNGTIYNDILSAKRYWLKHYSDEIRFERFTAWAECPKCLTLDLHPIKDALPKSCRRECTNCDYVWRQI